MGLRVRALCKSPWVFHVSAGSCNNCDIEILDLLCPRFDVERCWSAACVTRTRCW